MENSSWSSTAPVRASSRQRPHGARHAHAASAALGHGRMSEREDPALGIRGSVLKELVDGFDGDGFAHPALDGLEIAAGQDAVTLLWAERQPAGLEDGDDGVGFAERLALELALELALF